MMHRRTLAIVALTTTLVGCSAQGVPADTPPGQPEAIRIYATTAAFPLTLDLTASYAETQPQLTFDTQIANYNTVLQKILTHEAPYFISNHLPLESPLWAAPIGQDGIAVIVNPANRTESLTMQQLRAIYQGRLTRWDEINSTPDTLGDIQVYSRETGSGTRAEFDRMVMGSRPTTPNALVVTSSENMVASVARTEGSIGYVSMSYLRIGVRPVAIEDVLPTKDNVFRNRYPLRTTLFIIGEREPTGDYRLFFGWVQGAAGQQVVARHHTPLVNLTEQPTP